MNIIMCSIDIALFVRISDCSKLISDAVIFRLFNTNDNVESRLPERHHSETYPAKSRGMGLPYGENFIILTSDVRVHNRQKRFH